MKPYPPFSVIFLLLLIAAPASTVLIPKLGHAQEIPSQNTAADRLVQADRLFQQGIQQSQVSQFLEAIQSWQQALELYQDPAVQAAFTQQSRWREGDLLFRLGHVRSMLGQYQQAIDVYEQALFVVREEGIRYGEGRTLIELGHAHSALGQYQRAIDVYEQALVVVRETGDRDGEGRTLVGLGRAYSGLGQYRRAIDYHEQALIIAREIGARDGEGGALSGLGDAYGALGQYQQAIDYYQQALTITRETGARDGEGRTLGSLAYAYASLGQYQQAIDYHEQALIIAREIGARDGEGGALSGLGNAYSGLGQYQQAIDYYQQALTITRETGARDGEGRTLGSLAYAYGGLGQYRQAIDYHEQALIITRETGARDAEGRTLSGLAYAYDRLGQYRQAIDYHEQALIIAREIGARDGEGGALSGLGDAHGALGQYQQAIDYYQQALTITRETGARYGEGRTLVGLGHAYGALGQYQQAIDYYQQALTITHETGARDGEGGALSGLAYAYGALGQYQQAIDYHEQALIIARETGARDGEGSVLIGLGHAYGALGQYQQAIDYYQQALAIVLETGARYGEGTALGSLGNAYGKLGQYQQALERYQQALAIAQEIGARASEGSWLSHIGALLAAQGQPELAIVFYKQSVNIREAIRADIRDLSQEQQHSYTETIANDYRELADLLLQQNRILEAQRVLDLLRVQELDDYLLGVRSTVQTESGIDLRYPEHEISNRVIAIGYELAQLRNIPPNQLSDAQLQRLSELDTTQRELAADFQGFLNRPEIRALVAQLDASPQEQDFLARADEFINLQQSLRAIDQRVVLIYPLILEDRLEIILVTPFSEPARYSVPVGAAELNAAIVEFRQALNDPTSELRPVAQRLYTWLMAPMANDLKAIGAETILYAPDGALRYVPIAALHDGNQWLIESYRINHITSASLQNFTLRPSTTPRILAAAFSEGVFNFQIGQRSFSFDGLPFAGAEVENLAAAFPGTTQLMNDSFSRLRVEPIMDSHTIVHLATHAAFVPGSSADSFILFGNGDRLSLQELNSEAWRGRFNRVELVVLSACETGLGGGLGTGAEILGFGYLMQQAGAAAAIASLWRVNDGGTQVLMDAFYAALRNGYTKTEALQRAQIALITSNQSVIEGERSATVSIIDARTGQPLSQSNDLAHPYYWAPFILIGNGL
ncbi:tetratricopeptide repeat protein [Leptolyngbya sp. AN02str]|uniref:CHAT domain-containing protein n=1 Tax=Leptolyngbya sp. AN02str TaxID=3423363 RepID=UPI003D3109EE